MANISTVKSVVFSKNRTGIPKRVAVELGIEPGSVLKWTTNNGVAQVVKQEPTKPKRPRLSDFLQEMGKLGPIKIKPR